MARISTVSLLLCTLLMFPGVGWTQQPAFPVTIDHAFGTTTVTEKPERVATVAWANHEVPLALGVVPVGFAAAGFGDDDGDGLLPWVRARLDELDAAVPVLFDEGDGIDFEAVAATRPDVILAAYSGLTQADYKTLSMIAPVVAYPDSPWSTGWREMIRINSAALGMEEEGKALISRLEAQINEAVAGYPELEGKSAMFITHLDPTDLSILPFYSANDTRVSFFDDLGMRSPESVRRLTGEGQYSGAVSVERIDLFDDVDIFVTYGEKQLLGSLQSNPLLSRMRAIESGSVVLLGHGPFATAANPTPLSIPWVLDDYVAALADAARRAE
ncbi:iron complex transport system substrate-binding protein [Halopseudomonas xinjiangensis]|uniref:Iron complex transport system substrate-binding protein n=1 Tax=Halopseudomonas xinjiangensis TaxID=487184 RepID=A0A1H1STN4_9GAMM|nr:iron-siderophore ABC transporter substrate-binding protein [Halopseudomonas xinjiangensis]SDS51380.1 iron complex transport system substrate-binding protein [Halopseudomonas xinjiangensis]